MYLPRVLFAAALALAPQDPQGAGEPGGPVAEKSELDEPESLFDLLKNDSVFQIPAPTPPSASDRPLERNPFLLPEEQASGKPLEELLRERELEEKRRRDSEAAARTRAGGAGEAEDARAAIAAIVDSLDLTAILIAPDGGTAVIAGDLVDIGETVPSTQLVLVAVSRQGITLASGEDRFDKRLPPPRRRAKAPSSGDQEVEDAEGGKDASEEPEPQPGREDDGA